MLPQKRFYMIRHGQTEANEARLIAGSLDSPLTATGREQARQASLVLAGLSANRPCAILHSNLSRARDTAHILNEALNVPIYEDPDFAEIHAGDLEGVPYDSCREFLDDWADPPGGETYAQFSERIRRAKERALNKFDAPVLIVSHGGLFRAFGTLYSVARNGFRNCHLHEFEPDAANAGFPWKVWTYDREETITRRNPALYHLDDSHDLSWK